MADEPKDTVRTDLLLQLLQQRYPDRLRTTELESLRSNFEDILALSSALRAVKLEPHQEPFTQFKPYRQGE